MKGAWRDLSAFARIACELFVLKSRNICILCGVQEKGTIKVNICLYIRVFVTYGYYIEIL